MVRGTQSQSIFRSARPRKSFPSRPSPIPIFPWKRASYSLVATCKLNNVDPQAWLADVLARLPDYPANKVADLLPWNWNAARLAIAA
jgi:transposase